MKVLSTVLALALSACMAACSYKAAPDKVVQAGGSFKAVVEYTERCWEGCSTSPEIKLRHGRSTLGSAFYAREINLQGRRPYTKQVLFFPAKNMMLARLDVSNRGWLLAGFIERDGEPHLRVLAGCLELDGSIVTPEGLQAELRCPLLPLTMEFDISAPYSVAGGFSYHGAYWIDYLRQETHQVHINMMQTHVMEQVVGLTADRTAVLLLFRALDDEQDFLLCAAGGQARSATEACAPFHRRGAPRLRVASSSASAPFPSEQLKLYEIDDMPAARDWRDWLAQRFDLATLDNNGQPRALSKKAWK